MQKKKEKVEEKAQWGRVKNTLKMGIVGLPNVGKSSCFNLLSKLSIPAQNKPFCTIDPNLAYVPVPDTRYDKLCEMWQPKSKVPAQLEIIDIAGLVEGAHEGHGLGNAFLSNIQQVDGIFHMVRAFDDMDVVHVEGEVNPLRDMQIIFNELRLKDMSNLMKTYEELQKKVERFNDSRAVKELEHLTKAKECLEKGKWLYSEEFSNAEIQYLNEYRFFTTKPIVYLVNISTKNFSTKKNKWLKKIKDWVDENCPGKIIPFSVSYEEALLSGEVKGDSMVPKIIQAGYENLNLVHFFTCGKDEVRCWTVRKNSKAPQAAGVIHSDFELGFICAEVMKYEDFVTLGSEADVKKEGKYKQNGREYIVEDGDIIFFKFNKPNPKKKMPK